MIRLNLTALLYSNRNIELAYKAKRICRNVNINLINTMDFVDLTMKIMELKPQIVFFDFSTIKLEKQIMQLFVSKGDYYIPNIVLIYETLDSIKEYEEFNFSQITTDELEFMVEKEEKNFKMNATLFQQGKNKIQLLNSDINKELFSIGFSPKHTGYSYLVEAIKIVLKKDGVVGSLNNEVYPFIAAKYGTTVSNVERNIRNAIVCAYNCYEEPQNNVATQNLFFYFQTRPTNREFICMYIEQMIENFNRVEYK